MALRANAITTLANVKGQLDIPTAVTDQDAFLDRLINSASQQIEMYCNRPFVVASFVEYHDGNRTNELMMRRSPITTITSVYLDSGRVFGADSLVAATDYGAVSYNLVRKHTGTWGSGSQIVKVTYSAGYATIPADVEDACIMLVEQRYRIKADRSINKTSGNKTNESVSYLTEWVPEALALLEPYRVLNYVSASGAIMI